MTREQSEAIWKKWSSCNRICGINVTRSIDDMLKCIDCKLWRGKNTIDVPIKKVDPFDGFYSERWPEK